MSLSDIIREIKQDYLAGKQNPNAPASRDDIARELGIRNPETLPDWRVPVDVYREQDGTVSCQRSGRPPDPPRTVIARYELPDGSREVLAHQAYADVLERAYPLDGVEAEALARHRAGWDAVALEASVRASRALADVLADAKRTVEGSVERPDS